MGKGAGEAKKEDKKEVEGDKKEKEVKEPEINLMVRRPHTLARSHCQKKPEELLDGWWGGEWWTERHATPGPLEWTSGGRAVLEDARAAGRPRPGVVERQLCSPDHDHASVGGRTSWGQGRRPRGTAVSANPGGLWAKTASFAPRQRFHSAEAPLFDRCVASGSPMRTSRRRRNSTSSWSAHRCDLFPREESAVLVPLCRGRIALSGVVCRRGWPEEAVSVTSCSSLSG